MNNIENIDKIRREAISEIKEKIKRNPGYLGYLHPCNKERLEDMKTLGFSNRNEFTHWMQQNRIVRSPADIERDRIERIMKDVKKSEKGTLLWLKERANKDGFDNIKDWQNWKDSQRYNKELDEKRKNKFVEQATKVIDVQIEHTNNLSDLDKIRRDAITNIKYSIRKNPGHSGYLHPCNKERQDDIKRLEFSSGSEFTYWMQQNGIMRNPTDIERDRVKKIMKEAGCNNYSEYNERCARNAGFKDVAEKVKEWTHETGRRLPKEFNEDCSAHFGEFTENIMIQTFENAKKMPYGNPGFDWTCKNGDKIDNKGVCLVCIQGKSQRWVFSIKYNNIAEWFILSAWDNRDSLNPLHVWIFHKNDIFKGKKFWRRDTVTIIDSPKGLMRFKEYEVTDRLDKLKELCNKKKKKKTLLQEQ